MNSLVVALSLPRGGMLGEEAKCFIKEVKAEPRLPACFPPAMSDTLGLRVGTVPMLQMLALQHSFPGISGHRNFHPAVLRVAVQQTEVAYPA